MRMDVAIARGGGRVWNGEGAYYMYRARCGRRVSDCSSLRVTLWAHVAAI